MEDTGVCAVIMDANSVLNEHYMLVYEPEIVDLEI
jgi:hypothetical protein